jgi:L-lactate utilization protein LutB
MSAAQIGLIDAVRGGNYRALDRDTCKTPQERDQMGMTCLGADVFLTGANGLSLDGEMVNIDGTGNRVAAIIYGPKSVLVIAGMNKVVDTLEDAVTRARTVAAPMNQQRFGLKNPCTVTGTCADCKSESCICNQIVITRHCRPVGRIKFILVGEDLGM